MTVRIHQNVFFSSNKPPYTCNLCNVAIGIFDPKLIIHHVDGDATNNSPENLVAMHRGCHARHHYEGKLNTEHSKRMEAAWAAGKFANRRTWT